MFGNTHGMGSGAIPLSAVVQPIRTMALTSNKRKALTFTHAYLQLSFFLITDDDIVFISKTVYSTPEVVAGKRADIVMLNVIDRLKSTVTMDISWNLDQPHYHVMPRLPRVCG